MCAVTSTTSSTCVWLAMEFDYVVNSAGSLARKVKAVEGTQFCSPEAGFSVISANKQSLALYMIDGRGVAINKAEHRK